MGEKVQVRIFYRRPARWEPQDAKAIKGVPAANFLKIS